MSAESPSPVGADFNDIPTYASPKRPAVESDRFNFGAQATGKMFCEPHHWVTRIHRGLSVTQCSICMDINWDELETDMRRAVAKATGVPSEQSDHVTVIGVECFASLDGQVICWKGRNYVPQPAETLAGLLRELKRHGVTLSSDQEDYLLEVEANSEPVNTSERAEEAI